MANILATYPILINCDTIVGGTMRTFFYITAGVFLALGLQTLGQKIPLVGEWAPKVILGIMLVVFIILFIQIVSKKLSTKN